MRKLIAATLLASAAAVAAPASAASISFDFDQAASVFEVSSSTPFCPFQSCPLTASKLTFADATVEQGTPYIFDFGRLTAGGLAVLETNAAITATLAFITPDIDPVTSTANVAYVKAFGLFTAGGIVWNNATKSQSFSTAQGDFTVSFLDVVGLTAGNSANAPIRIDVTSVPAVPEPATWAMMIAGFGMVGGAMRRRNVTTKVSFA